MHSETETRPNLSYLESVTDISRRINWDIIDFSYRGDNSRYQLTIPNIIYARTRPEIQKRVVLYRWPADEEKQENSTKNTDCRNIEVTDEEWNTLRHGNEVELKKLIEELMTR